MCSASKNLFFHHFSVNPPSNKVHSHELVSLRQNDDKIFQVYIENLKKFKPHYFFGTFISPTTHSEFCNFSTSSSASTTCTNKARRFWTPYHFEEKVSFFFVSYNFLIVKEKTMKSTLLFFLTMISCRNFTHVNSIKDRKKCFGT